MAKHIIIFQKEQDEFIKYQVCSSVHYGGPVGSTLSIKKMMDQSFSTPVTDQGH